MYEIKERLALMDRRIHRLEVQYRVLAGAIIVLAIVVGVFLRV